MNLQGAPPQLFTQPAGLMGAATNYQFPITQGLMGSLQGGGSLGTAHPGSTNFSEQALAMAGYPKAGPLAPAPVPSGPGVPGGPSTGGGGIGSTVGGLLTAVAQNPNILKSGIGVVKNLLGTGAPASSLAPLTASDIAASDAADGGLMADVNAVGLSPDVSAALGSTPAAATAAADGTSAGAAGGDYGINLMDSGGADAGGGASGALAAAGPGLVFGAGLAAMGAAFNHNSALTEADAIGNAQKMLPQIQATNPAGAASLQSAIQAALNGDTTHLNYLMSAGGMGTGAITTDRYKNKD